MAKSYRANTALCLHRFARVIDNEGIDNRHIANQHLWPAILRERNSFAWQPFQRTMRPDMNQRIDLRPDPQP